MRSFAAVPLIAASLASATIYVTAPVASTVCNVGTPCPINWNDDGNVPVLATIGPCSIDLCTGGQFAQTCLENISPSTDVSQIASVMLNINAAVGQSGDYYFIKYTSLAYKDPATPTLPFTAFSAKFTLNGMTGTFNSTVLGQIAQGTQSQAVVTPAGASTTAAAATPSFLAATTKAAAATTASASKAATTSAKSGAVGVTVPGVVSSVVAVSFASVLLGFVAFGL